jgi:hypothetical protein
MKLYSKKRCLLLYFIFLNFAFCWRCFGDISTGSDGHDGFLNPTSDIIIDMADHPDGIYQYSVVNIPAQVSVSFKPNAKNTPVTWLIQGSCVVSGTLNISGKDADGALGGNGGPGGWRGGTSGKNPTSGEGPGGGLAGAAGGGGSFGTTGKSYPCATCGNAGPIYGNSYLLPLIGGSGGGGSQSITGGGGGGGAILIAASDFIRLDGTISSTGGNGSILGGVGGSGGAVRLLTKTFQGTGYIQVRGGTGQSDGSGGRIEGGLGRIRLDCFENLSSGNRDTDSTFTQGFQQIIFQHPGNGVQLSILKIGGNDIGPNPSGILADPDSIIAGSQNNPIPVVVHCSYLPLNTPVTVIIRSALGGERRASGLNDLGSEESSTANILINIPRGGGIIYATASTAN